MEVRNLEKISSVEEESDPEYDGAYPMLVPIEGKNRRRALSPMEVRNLEKTHTHADICIAYMND